jgi:hypothetical protein
VPPDVDDLRAVGGFALFVAAPLVYNDLPRGALMLCCRCDAPAAPGEQRLAPRASPSWRQASSQEVLATLANEEQLAMFADCVSASFFQSNGLDSTDEASFVPQLLCEALSEARNAASLTELLYGVVKCAAGVVEARQHVQMSASLALLPLPSSPFGVMMSPTPASLASNDTTVLRRAATGLTLMPPVRGHTGRTSSNGGCAVCACLCMPRRVPPRKVAFRKVQLFCYMGVSAGKFSVSLLSAPHMTKTHACPRHPPHSKAIPVHAC